MKKFIAILFFSLVLFLPLSASAASASILNIYAWTGEVPDFVIRQFEKETGITVNFATYENNEVMYAKLRAVKNPGYDLVMPSSYFVDRMRRQMMLEKLDKTRLPNWKHLNPDFLNPSYDPNTDYSVPFLWGVTGLFYNERYYAEKDLTSWADLWAPRFDNKLMLLDDSREVFSMALLTLGYSANDRDPKHIEEAFLKLKELMKNVKLFASDTVVSTLIDEDARAGMAWNGDAFKAYLDNPNLRFVFPKEGFVIWVDNFSIPKNAPHKENAYAFINFILRPDIAKQIALSTQFPIANSSAQKLLPENIRNSPVIYPSKEVMRRGQFQTDLGDETLALIEKYWEELKMSG